MAANGRVRLPHLVGQRFEELANLIGPAGAFALEGKASAAALSTFRAHESLRTSLCHGVGKIVLDQQGVGCSCSAEKVTCPVLLASAKALREPTAMERQYGDRLLSASGKPTKPMRTFTPTSSLTTCAPPAFIRALIALGYPQAPSAT